MSLFVCVVLKYGFCKKFTNENLDSWTLFSPKLGSPVIIGDRLFYME